MDRTSRVAGSSKVRNCVNQISSGRVYSGPSTPLPQDSSRGSTHFWGDCAQELQAFQLTVLQKNINHSISLDPRTKRV